MMCLVISLNKYPKALALYLLTRKVVDEESADIEITFQSRNETIAMTKTFNGGNRQMITQKNLPVREGSRDDEIIKL